MGHAIFLFDLGIAFAVLVQVYDGFLEFFRVTSAFLSWYFFFLPMFSSIIPCLSFFVHFFSIAPELTAKREQKNAEYNSAKLKAEELSQAAREIEQYLRQEQSRDQQQKRKRNDLE